MTTFLRTTSLHGEHIALGARLVPFAGWEMPIQYTGIVDEHQAVRTAGGLFDASHMGELRLRGPYAAHVVDYLVTNDARKIADGQAMYTCACNDVGGVLDDLIVIRRSAEDWLVVVNGANREKMARHFAHAAKDHCDFDDESDATALLALQGPRAFDVLAAVSAGGDDPRSLSSFHVRDAQVAGVACACARTGYTGEDGVELFCAWDEAPRLWRALLAAGATFGVKPAGLGARDTLRLEARLSLYGNEIDETTNPLEAGLGWVVKMNKGDFVGRAALERIAAAGLRRKLVGFEMVGRGVARHGYPLLDAAGREVGVCTSGSPGPTVGKNIGLGYLPSEMSVVGTSFAVSCRGKAIEAVVVPTPFYKRRNPGESP
ncbi:MAG: glycine cleavage system aminomethyltransferase GcvT [Polyangiaceae bacterium]|nr:glycine cleavage system aminomethyltransferase GcvT [Polyangiaceae bacterium]